MANCFYMIWQECGICKSLPSLIVSGEPGKRHALRAHMPEAATDWLNPLSLWTMSASAYIENLAKNSARLIIYQEITRSIKIFLV